ncbi:TPA: filamentous hemagglutinin, partial [Serratia marcescens]
MENNHLNLPNGLMDAGRATSTLSKFMTEHGATPEEVMQAQSDLAKGLGTGAPQPATELVKKWALLMSTAATMGTGSAVGVGAAATGGAIGGAANVSTQLTVNGDKPFSYTDALLAIGTGALSQGKGPLLTGGVSVGGAYVGSTIKGEDPTNAMIGAGVGSAIGS